MKLIDTHTHLYAAEFDADRTEMVNRAIEAGVEKMFLPQIDSSSFDAMMNLHNQFPGNCFPMMGLHPCSVTANYLEELRFVEEQLGKHKFYGIGETGIDLYWDKTFQKQQEESFAKHVEWAADLGLPLIIHTRNSFEVAIEIVEKAKKRPRGIFHCFSGTANDARRIMDLKTFKMGIGGSLTYKNSTLPAVMNEVPMEFIVLETDSPYLPPVPYRGKRNESAYLVLVAHKLAEVKQLPVNEVAHITTENALSLFSI